MEHSRLVVHRTVLAVDIEGYGHQSRTTPHRLVVRQGLDLALRRAFKEAGVPWFDCKHETTGDGTLVLVPAQILKGPFVEVLSASLAGELRRHNETHRAEEQIRLRMALHAGEVAYDDHGATGPALNQTFRLIEAPQLKIALAESPGTLALIVSKWFFDEVVRSSTVVDPATFRPVHVAVKETATVGWISLPDHPYPPNSEALTPADGEEPAVVSFPAPASGRSTLPRDLPAFTGRGQELAELTATVSTAAGQGTLGMAVHVVDGMPGIGKTTFAVRAAYQLARYFPDGQVFLELHGHSPGQAAVDPGDALASLLLLWGVPASTIPPVWTTGPGCGGKSWRGARSCCCWTTPSVTNRSGRCCRAAPAASCWSPAGAGSSPSPTPARSRCRPSRRRTPPRCSSATPAGAGTIRGPWPS
jgi:hypothetical protein